MDTDEQPVRRRRASRKSVTFTDEKVVVNPDGSIVRVVTLNDDHKDTAQSHVPHSTPLEDALEEFANQSQEELAIGNGEVAAEAAADIVAANSLDLSLKKKKKKSIKKIVENGDEAENGAEAGEVGDEAAVGDDDAAGLDLSLKRKKKKPKKNEDDFAKKLEALGSDGKAEGEANREDAGQGDMDRGTGVWTHDEGKPISYALLLPRFYALLTEKNPEHAAGANKSHKIPPPQCMREGNKKTIFANIAEICKRMNRTEEHMTAYMFAELGTSGSVDGSRRLVIKGRFQSKQIENVLRKYIIDYVTCKTCRSPDTDLSKGENRLYFITCLSCGSRRSVQAIKTGFSAQVGKRKKMQG